MIYIGINIYQLQGATMDGTKVAKMLSDKHRIYPSMDTRSIIPVVPRIRIPMHKEALLL